MRYAFFLGFRSVEWYETAIIRRVKSQKSADLNYMASEVWNHETLDRHFYSQFILKGSL
jgi:hypothetical protein